MLFFEKDTHEPSSFEISLTVLTKTPTIFVFALTRLLERVTFTLVFTKFPMVAIFLFQP